MNQETERRSIYRKKYSKHLKSFYVDKQWCKKHNKIGYILKRRILNKKTGHIREFMEMRHEPNRSYCKYISLKVVNKK